MTADELKEVQHLIELATEVGQARQKELFRCVEVVVQKAKLANEDAALVLYDAARAMLDER